MAGEAILNNYFKDRHVDIGDPRIDREDIARRILGAKDSAPGLDGMPYEVYHHGLHFMTALLEQALLASTRSDQELLDILGEAEDLAIWIPKKEDLETCDGLRPLQLPTCLRRLFGTIIMGQIGPQVEPQFSAHQAAVLGGSCCPNIKKVFQHLKGEAVSDHRTRDYKIMDEILGPQAQAVRELAREYGCKAPGKERAAFFADQSKAFERVGYKWFFKVMEGWKFPRWVVRSLAALTVNRKIQMRINGWLGPSGGWLAA